MQQLNPTTKKQKVLKIVGGLAIIVITANIGHAIGSTGGGAFTLIGLIAGLALIGNAMFSPSRPGGDR